MDAQIILFKGFDDQRPGTSGLRKSVARFREAHYLESFTQAIIDATPGFCEGPLLLGGDGRYFNREAIQILCRILVANRVPNIRIGLHGLLSTPAASHLIRNDKLAGAILLTASHNPGGPDGDFGVKFNVASGSPAPESVTEAVYQRARSLTEYRIAQMPHIDIDHIGRHTRGDTVIEVIDTVTPYLDFLETIFDFDAIRTLIRRADFDFRFDAMHAVTGAYATPLFVDRLGATEHSLLRADPLSDFGGRAPDPSPEHAADLMRLMFSKHAPAFGAASDGDGDRNMILGPHCFVSPGDSLAILTANAHHIPRFANGLKGVARSMPTSRAVDQVAAALGIECFETPTGWKYFGNLLDADRISLCGEESFGTSSDHIREKDGLWAVLFWLNLLAKTGRTVPEIVRDHWARFGRHATLRLDYEEIESRRAGLVIERLRERLPALPGQRLADLDITAADEFTYHDPIDGSVSEHQGLRIIFGERGRIVVRLSGTGTKGATLRIYLEKRVEGQATNIAAPAEEILTNLAREARSLLRLTEIIGRDEPSTTV